MNVLVATLGSYGDVFPMVAIAARLRARGQMVTLFTNAHFQKLALKHGVKFVPLGTEAEHRHFADHPDLFDPRKSFSVFMNTVALPNIRRAYEQLKAHIEPNETVIVASLAVFAARLLQEKFNIPTVTVHLTPLAIKSAYAVPKVSGPRIPDWFPRSLKQFYWWVADKVFIDPVICLELNALRKEIGLAPVDRVLTRWVHSPQRVICMFPEWYASPQPDWPPNTYLTGFPLFDEGDEDELPGKVVEFLRAGEAPVVFMPGSLMQHGSLFFEESLGACQALGRRGILLSRFAHQIPEHLPEGIRHFAYVPFGKLLPHTAALVHHGGIGTSAQAMRAGVPQLIHPMAHDQYDNAARLHALGVADWINPGDYRAPAVVDRLQRLTESSAVLEQCRAVADRFENTDPLLETCELIEATLQH
jgi:rhamnosyltransferase subunit B